MPYWSVLARLHEKLTGNTTMGAYFLQIGIDLHTTDATDISLLLYTREVLSMHPQALASGPQSYRGNNFDAIP